MASGKTTVGREVARQAGRRFLDLDEEIVRRESREIETIFRESGEPAFRCAEWQALQALEIDGGPVVAVGGGAFSRADPRRWMRDRGRTVWLDVPLDRCAARAGGGAGRPLWPEGDPLALRARYDRRRAAYALAEIRLEAGSDDPPAVARRLLDRLDPGGSSKPLRAIR